MKKVEQITSSGKIVTDADISLSKIEIDAVLTGYFGEVQRERFGFRVIRDGKEYLLLVKNITYLGHPHPVFKKRIQIPFSWSSLLSKENVLLLGIYTYRDTSIIVFFDKKARGKSSSAHVSSIDLQKAVEYGIFRKIDKMGNRIIACRSDRFLETFDNIAKGKEVENVVEIEVFEKFSRELPFRWDGISAYEEMMKRAFPNALQGEWPGFFLEFKFGRFLSSNKAYSDICRYVSRKKVSELDFDLEFPRGKFVGDLKTHSRTSSAILGNDKYSVEQALVSFGKIWYVVFELEYRMDKDFECEVSRYWNAQLNNLGRNKSETSYCRKMKHDGLLIGMHVLELNRNNTRHLSDFRQGKQPDGSKRNVKVKIDKRMIDNFVIFRKELFAGIRN